MGDNETEIALLKQRVDQHDEIIEDMRISVKNIEANVTTLVTKLSDFNPSGCMIHTMRLEEFGKRLDVIETKTDSLTQKIIAWTAIASVILFLLSQLVIPYVLDNVTVSKKQPVTVEVE